METLGPDRRLALRAEHDRIAEEIGTRLSVDHVQNGGVLAFFSVIAVGLTVKLAWDRWGWLPVNKPKPPPGVPAWVLMALVLAAVLIGFSVRELLRARRLRAVEDEKFQRLLLLRKELELDT
jgi:type VI protein secretion system component VasK